MNSTLGFPDCPGNFPHAPSSAEASKESLASFRASMQMPDSPSARSITSRPPKGTYADIPAPSRSTRIRGRPAKRAASRGSTRIRPTHSTSAQAGSTS